MVSKDTDALEIVRLMKAIIITSILAFLIPQVHVQEPTQVHPAPKREVVYAEPVEVETPAKVEAVAQVEEPKPEPKPVAPAQEPKAVQAPKKHPKGCENYRHLISKYDWNVEVALNICHAESSGNPLAVGDNYPIRGLHAPSCGLFQVRTLKGRPSCEALKDPATNIAWAYKIYLSQGYKAWSVCQGKVRCY